MSEKKSGRDQFLKALPWIVATPFALWAVVHAIRSRTLEEFFRYSAYIAVPLAALVLIVHFVTWIRNGYRWPSGEDRAVLLWSPLLAAFYGALFYAISASLNDAYLWLRAPWSKGSLVVFTIAFAVLLFGLALFYFRLRLRSLYGLTEIFVGIIVAAQRTSVTADVERENVAFYLVLLTAGVYLIVRGLDNIHYGLTKDPYDPVAKYLLKSKATGAEAGQAEKQPATN